MKIFRFYLFFCLALSFPALHGDDFKSFSPEKTLSGIEIRCADMTKFTIGIVRKLKLLDRLTVQFLHPDNFTAAKQPCQIRISDKFPPGTLKSYLAGKQVILELSDADDSCFYELGKFKKLLEAMVFSRLGVFRDGENFIPDWFAAGMMGELDSLSSSGMLVRDARYFPLLRALTGKKDPVVIDWEKIPLTSGEGLTGSMLSLYIELCRVFLLAADSLSSSHDNALTDCILLFDRRGKDFSPSAALNSTIFRLANAVSGNNSKAFFRDFADRTVFNVHHPRPGEMFKRLLAEWRQCTLPELDRNNLPKPDGKKIKVDILELPLRVKENFAYASEFRRKQRELNPLLRSAPGEFHEELKALIFALHVPDNAGDFNPVSQYEKLNSAINALNRSCDLRAGREEALLKYEKEYLPTGERYRANLHEMNVRDFLGEKGKRFLDETEKKYYSE